MTEFTESVIDSVSTVVDNKIGQFEKKLDTISKLPEQINKNCESFAQVLKRNLPAVSEVAPDHNTQHIKIAVKEALIEGKKDEMRIDDRKQNIILFNVAESHADTPVKRENEDVFFSHACIIPYARTTSLIV